MVELIEATGRYGTELADTQVRALGRQLDTWTTQHETAAACDLQPGGLEYRTQFEQTQAEQALAVDYGNEIAAMDAAIAEFNNELYAADGHQRHRRPTTPIVGHEPVEQGSRTHGFECSSEWGGWGPNLDPTLPRIN